jgi:hypothetical protein
MKICAEYGAGIIDSVVQSIRASEDSGSTRLDDVETLARSATG